MNKQVQNLILIGAVVGIFFLSGGASLFANKRQRLIDWAKPLSDGGYAITKFQQMTDSEIDVVYDYVFNYLQKSKPVPVGSPLYMQLETISNKYNIFT